MPTSSIEKVAASFGYTTAIGVGHGLIASHWKVDQGGAFFAAIEQGG